MSSLSLFEPDKWAIRLTATYIYIYVWNTLLMDVLMPTNTSMLLKANVMRQRIVFELWVRCPIMYKRTKYRSDRCFNDPVTRHTYPHLYSAHQLLHYVATLVTRNYKYIESMPQRNKQGILVHTIRTHIRILRITAMQAQANVRC